MSMQPHSEGAEAQEILDTLEQIQADPELRAEAQTNPEGLLDRLNLSTIARQAVALGIAGFTVAASNHQHITPNGWWN